MNDKVCTVCGDRAIGTNFGALTCESCRSFFRRNATRFEEFGCFFGDNCEVNRLTRKFCKKCRIDRCLANGMKKEALTYGENNDSRRYRRKRPKNGAPIVSVTDEHKVESCLTLEINRFKELFNSLAVVRGNPVTTIAYETNTASDGIQLIQNRADLKFTRMVKMSANINGFNELCEDDKIALLKAGCPQLWLLQNIVDFDVEGQFWRIPIHLMFGSLPIIVEGILPLHLEELSQLSPYLIV
ncbi:unnamed protein product [Medioppia subpectinata]|uniref:Nuclear receptor domain-containing protein n=1 Tax=Medioppia subpectinata TaxID=1979941 RepID=A0A7R9Q2D2_9ACAR|nr:unnamed protein product [Medioppia subpectinata]CAG2110248.1 unnamed protein product [Medioppia subpectinata]